MTDRVLTNELYDGTSDLGLFRANLSWWVGVVIGGLLALVGIMMMLSNDDDEYFVVQGVVSEPSCKEYNSDGKLTYKCNTGVSYKVDKKTYTVTIFTSGTSDYIMNQPVELRVKKTRHMDVAFNTPNSRQTGAYLIAGGTVIVGLVYLNRYIAQTYKPYAMAQGVRTMLGFVI